MTAEIETLSAPVACPSSTEIHVSIQQIIALRHRDEMTEDLLSLNAIDLHV